MELDEEARVEGNLNRLYTEICNHITLGQWQPARACCIVYAKNVRENNDQKRLDKLKGLLLEVACNPLLCIGSRTIPSPLHLSLLSTILLEELELCEEDEIKYLKKEVNFKLLLMQCEKNGINDVPYEDCCGAFYKTQLKEKTSDGHVHQLSSTVKQFIKVVLEKDVPLACIMYNLIDNEENLKSKSANVILLWLLDKCHVLRTIWNECKEGEQLKQQKDNLLKALATYIYRSNHLLIPEVLCRELFDLCQDGVLKIETVYLILCCNADAIKKFCDLENVYCNRLMNDESLESKEIFLESVFKEDGSLDFKELYLRTVLNEKHFLEIVVNLLVELVTVQNFVLVNRCLANELFAPLRPLVILMAWEEVSSPENANKILGALWLPNLEKDVFDSGLSNGCDMLYNETKVASWCIEQFRINLDAVRCELSFIELCRLMRETSALNTLNKCFYLSKIKDENIEEILTCSGSKSAIFSELNKDFMIFQSYKIMRTLIDAIIPKGRKTENRLNIRTNDVDGVDVSKKCSNTFDDDIHQIFIDMQTLIQTLYPVSYRIEILENLFTLLFATYDDIVSDALSDTEYGNEAADDLVSDTQGFNAVHVDDHMQLEQTKESSKSDFLSKSVKTTRAEESRSSKDEHGQFQRTKSSDNASSFCTCSSSTSASDCCSGFLCDDKIIHPLLTFIQENLVEAAIIINSQHPSGPRTWSEFHNTEKDDFQTLRKIHQSIARLKQYVSEALWKLEIVQVPQSQNLNRDQQTDLCISFLEPSLKRTKSHTSYKDEETEKASKHQHKRRSLSHRFYRMGRCQAISCEHKTINCMLSSPESLLNMCLLQNDLQKANQVIQTYSLQKTDGAAEVSFLMEYADLISQLKVRSSCDTSSTSLHSHSLVPVTQSITQSNLSSISQTAAVGLHTTLDSHIIDNVLTRCTIPGIPELTKLQATDSQFVNSVELIDCLDLRTVTLADMLFTDCLSLEVCYNIASSALRRITSKVLNPSKSCSSISDNVITGFTSYLKRISSLTGTILSKQSEFPHLYNSGVMNKYANINEYLISSIDPLDAQDYSLMTDNYNHLAETLNTFELALNEAGIEKLHIVPENLSSSLKHKLNLTFHNLVLAASEIVGQGICESREKSKDDETVDEYPDYLKSLFVYLQQLVTLFNKCNECAGYSSEITYLEVLGKDLTSTLGDLMLNTNISPRLIEEFTDKLNISLGHIIVKNICHSLPAEEFPHCIAEPPVQSSNQKVLNNKAVWIGDARNPVLVAEELIHQLINMILEKALRKDTVLYSELVNVKTHSSWAFWLEAVNELAAVDLTKLKTSNEVVAFLINVTNLLSIHTMIFQDMQKHLSQYSVSQRVADACAHAYCVGQLGIISLFELHCLLELHYPCAFGLPPEMLARIKKVFPHDVKLPQRNSTFALHLGTLDSPKLQVVTTDMVQEQLDIAADEYLNFHTSLDVPNSKILIPSLIKHYQPQLELAYSYWDRVHSYCNEELREVLIGLRNVIGINDCDIIFRFTSCNNTSGIVFDYNGIQNLPLPEKKDHINEVILPSIPPVVQEYLDEKYPITSHVMQLLAGIAPPKKEFDVLHCFLKQFSDVPVIDILIPSIHAVHFWEKLDNLFAEADISGVFSYLQSSLKLRPELIPCLWAMQDYILCNFSMGSYIGCEDDAQQHSWLHADRIKNPRIRTNCVLSYYKAWPYEGALHMLQKCLFDDLTPNDMKEKLELHVKRLHNYQQVLRWKEDLGLWQHVAEESTRNPEVIVEALLSNHKYQLALAWAKFHNVSSTIQQQLDQSYLMSLLDKAEPDILAARIVLNNMESEKACIYCCEQLFQKCNNIAGKEFLLKYLLVLFEDMLTLEQKKIFTTHRMGIKIVQSLPSKEQEEYVDIVTSPMLILEQMIMNMKIDYVTKYIKEIQSSSDANLMNMFDDIDALLKKYATEAIKVPIVVPYYRGKEPESSDTLSSQEFVIPPAVPTKEQWYRDEEFSACMICKQDFTMLNRRHHCRRCGRILCGNCSKCKLKIEGYGNVKVRVCDDCQKQKTIAETAEMPIVATEEKNEDTGSLECSFVGSVMHSTSFSHSLQIDEVNTWKLTMNEEHNNTAREEFTFEMIPNVHLSMCLLRLHREQHKCADFILELCKSLLSKLQPNRDGSPNREVDYDLIISMVESLLMTAKLKYSELQMYDNISTCDHVKAFLAVSRILVQNNCHHLLPEDMKTVTDTKQWTWKQRDFSKKLLNSLLEEERWSLAIEVMPKLQMERVHHESSAVWRSWGLAALKAGELPTAKEKFSRALSNTSGQSNSKFVSCVIDDIISVLEKRLYSADDDVGSILQSLASLKTMQDQGVVGLKFPQVHGECVSKGIFEECMYYLDSYSTPTRTLSFLIKHKKLEKALQYVIDKKWSPESFINGIALPCLKMHIETLLEEKIRLMDPTLQYLKNHLFTACQYLEKKMQFDSLLKFQEILKDHAGASVTCIKLYHKNALNFTNLQGNCEYLHAAYKHLEHAVLVAPEPSSPTVVTWNQKEPKTYNSEKLRKQMRIIQIQLDANKFLVDNDAEALNTEEIMANFPKERPYTLFGTSGTRVQLCALIIICGKTIEDGYPICSSIIQEFELNVVMVFGSCCRCLTKIQRVSDIKQLIECIRASGNFKSEIVDEIISNCICQLHQHLTESKEGLSLIKMIYGIEHKINAYILFGKLKSAYLLAIQDNRIADVQRILSTADRLGQMAVKNICMQWLATRQS